MADACGKKNRVQVFRPQYDGLLQGKLGVSTRYNEYVWDMIRERMPVSIFYGLATFFFTYIICIPLGILKAIKHRTVLDNVSSVLIFVGYAVPGFVLASVLVVYLAARMAWFPTGGFVSEDFDTLSHRQDLGCGPSRRITARVLPHRQLCLHDHAGKEQPHGQLRRRLCPHRDCQGGELQACCACSRAAKLGSSRWPRRLGMSSIFSSWAPCSSR